MSSQRRSPAKREQPPDDSQVKSTRSSSRTARQQEVSPRHPRTPRKERTVCKGCGKDFQNLMTHLKAKEECAAFYDMKDMQKKMEEKRRELDARGKKDKYHNSPGEANKKRAASRDYYENHTPEKKATMTGYNEDNRDDINKSMRNLYLDPTKKEEKKEAVKEQYALTREKRKAEARKHHEENKEKRRAAERKRYREKRPEILEQKALLRKAYFEKKIDYERFMDFKNAMKNVCAYGCICCHRILSSTGKENLVKGGLDGLEKQLKGYFKHCILNREKLPPQLKNAKDIYLCSTCNRWLFQFKEMPPMCYKNGLEVDPIPPGLKDLNELEEPLIARRIIFLKLYNLPVSRWFSFKDHAINVPIEYEDILNSLAAVTQFPRLPDEAGHVPVDLKRRKKYKNTHKSDYIQPKKLIKALEELIELENPGWSGIKIVNRYPVLADKTPDEESSDSEEEDDTLDCVKRNQLNREGSTMMTSTDPTVDVLTNLPREEFGKNGDQRQPPVAVAPGEGKVPHSLTSDENWDVLAFPKLYPTGKFGLHHPRNHSTRKNLTYQEFFQQRLCNVDPRWRQHAPFVFAALYCIERRSLEKAMSISYRRGKVGKDGKLTNLEDACCIFDNQPGSDKYWLKRRYEVLAKLEQLGPFQLFFTLSCADKRWDENFVAILQQRGATIHFRPSKEQPDPSRKYSYQADDIFVEENGKEKPLKKYLEENMNLHETVKENVLTITMIFDKRVQAFLNKIIMAPSNPQKAKYYHYRVEFQRRGAGHIHGVLWLDLDQLETTFPGLKSAFKKLKDQESLNKKEKNVVAAFVDSCSTCDLKDEDLAETVLEVQYHRHKGDKEKMTGCYKKGKTCRFNFPKLPSERTIIAQPMKKGEMTDRAYDTKLKEYKEVLQKVKDKLVELTEDGNKECTLLTDDLLEKAEVSKKTYYEALEVSQNAACIILKRDPREAYINNYNPEWMKAWDGNMDIQVCLDYFAIITYITDYYTKTESGVTKAISAAVKASKERGDDMTKTMRHLSHAFLTSREMGESEAYYRIFPHLHLSQSNVKCTFVATGFKENRSTMVMPMNDGNRAPDKEYDEDDPNHQLDDESTEDRVEIAGSNRKFKRVTQIHEKYENRPSSLQHMCLAQFAISYDMMTKAAGKKREYEEDGSSKERSKRVDMKLVSYDSNKEKPLPLYIKLGDDLGYMRLRDKGGRSVLRRYKIREDKSPHEYYYSQLLLFYPWKKEEEELHRESLEECRRLFEEMDIGEMAKECHERRSKIERIQEKLFPHLNDVEEGRAVVAHLDDHRPTHIGDQMDPQNVVENEEAEEEGSEIDEAHAGRFPSEALRKLNESQLPPTTGTFNMIPIPRDDREYAKMQEDVDSLDDDQRLAFDIVYKDSRERRANTPGHKPVHLIVHGGAGSGKTHLVNTMAKCCEHSLRVGTKMSGTSFPAVIKLAPTGKASNLIDGLTLHKAFNLPWSNQYYSLSEKTREVKRNELRYLSLVIIDEMSMVKADQLYQIDQRLQEIKQNRLPFGGVSIVLSGDLYQLPPVKAKQIFEAPKNEKYKECYEMNSLWDMFECIELTHNHRQAEDWEYAEMLNRIRVGKQTEEDMKLLATRISDESPHDALYVFGKNVPCTKHNNAVLDKLDGEMHSFMAHHPRGGRFKRICEKTGLVTPTPFMEELRLKEEARVMLINNVDTSDFLSNGSCGNVAGFEWSGGKRPEISKILVQFDDLRAGTKERARHPKNPKHPEATPVSRVSWEYSKGKAEKRHASKSKLIQFPLVLAWAITCHKVQGMGLKPPKKLVADLDSCFEKAPGMAYVMLGRVQNLSQLILRWSYDPNPKDDAKSERKRRKNNREALQKIMTNEEAHKEAMKLKAKALNNPENLRKNHWLHMKTELKVTSLNVQGSLKSRLLHLRKDKSIMVSDIICLQETGQTSEALNLNGYTGFHGGGAKNKGVSIYVRDGMTRHILEPQKKFDNQFYQVLKLCCTAFDIITVYLANGQTASSIKG